MDELNVKMENLNLVEDYNRKGLSLKAELDELKEFRNGNKPAALRIDDKTADQLFILQFNAVKDSPAVQEATSALAKARDMSIVRMLLNDPEYRAIHESYKQIITDEFLKKTEKNK